MLREPKIDQLDLNNERKNERTNEKMRSTSSRVSEGMRAWVGAWVRGWVTRARKASNATQRGPVQPHAHAKTVALVHINTTTFISEENTYLIRRSFDHAVL